MSKKEIDLSDVRTSRLIASKNYIGRPEFEVGDELVERQWTMTSANLVTQDWHGPEDDGDVVIGFAETKKRLIANITNRRAIHALYGSGDFKDVWQGKTLTLVYSMVEISGSKRGRKIRNPSGGEPGGVRVKGK